jgi:hypothetical protein
MKSMDNMNNSSLGLLDILTIISFVLQVQNNDELKQQSSNDEVLQKLHNDVMALLEDNRELFNIVIKQNDEILDYLKGDYYDKTRNKKDD